MKKIIITITITILILLALVGYLYFRYLNPISANESNLNTTTNEVDENDTENESTDLYHSKYIEREAE